MPAELGAVSIASVLRWLDHTAWSTALRESILMYPLIESTHVIVLGLFVGLTVMWDLRLLGLAFTTVPVSELARRMLPWSRAGFYIMFATGALLFSAMPIDNYHNVFFRVKMILLVLALVNIWYFHRRTERSISAWDTRATPSRAARVGGATSIFLWFAIVVAGRMIAYNWFDCEQPRSTFVVWAAGCGISALE